MKHLTVYFSVLFFYIFSDEFYWILCQGSPAVILWRYKNVNLILAPEFHLFFFYFRNFISFFPCFSKTCRKLQFPEFFSHFYIFFIFFLPAPPSFFLSVFPDGFLIQSSSFIPSFSVFCFSFSIKFPSFLCHHFLNIAI